LAPTRGGGLKNLGGGHRKTLILLRRGKTKKKKGAGEKKGGILEQCGEKIFPIKWKERKMFPRKKNSGPKL